MLNELWLLVSIVVLFIGLVASQGLILVLGALSLIVSLVAKYWDRFAFQKVEHSRTLMQNRAFVGDNVEYVITLSNEKALPLIWVDIQDAFPEGLELPGGILRGTWTVPVRSGGTPSRQTATIWSRSTWPTRRPWQRRVSPR